MQLTSDEQDMLSLITVVLQRAENTGLTIMERRDELKDLAFDDNAYTYFKFSEEDITKMFSEFGTVKGVFVLPTPNQNIAQVKMGDFA